MSSISSISQSTHVLRDCDATLVVETPCRYSFENFPLKPAKSDGYSVHYVTPPSICSRRNLTWQMSIPRCKTGLTYPTPSSWTWCPTMSPPTPSSRVSVAVPWLACTPSPR
eukprot:1131300-Amphidinium_carterae.1